jgi:hypothetical protein
MLDSGYTNHMIGERRIFTSFEKNECEGDCITFGDNSQGQVLGFSKIAITTEHSISKVLLVESLDYNLLSVLQFYEMSYNCLFTDKGLTVFKRSDGSFAFKDVLKGKLYLVDFIPEEVELDRCLITKTNMDWLWHRWLAHIGMMNLHKLQKDGHILELTNIIFEKDRPYSACQARKQVRTHHHTKNIMTMTRPLEMLHMDLFSPVAYITLTVINMVLSLLMIILFTWVFFLDDKSETQEVLKRFLRRAKNEFDAKVKKIRSDNRTEFKNTQVEDFLDE